VVTALADGVLLAQTTGGSTDNRLSRSTDQGRTWRDVLSIGSYRALTPHSFAELNGAVYFAEYQSFTSGDAPIRVWASTDRGVTWSVRSTHTGHRHAHGIRADASRGALWLFFGDTTPQSATLRSTDGGRTWTTVRSGQEAIAVDGAVLPNGDLLYGQDSSYLPTQPSIARLTPGGGYRKIHELTGPSYSIHALRGGGFVAGAAREPGGNIYPPGEESTRLYGSVDGERWEVLLTYRRVTTTDNARIDVSWELPSGELVLRLENVPVGSANGGRGFQLLRPRYR
jgi:hypothetical protein